MALLWELRTEAPVFLAAHAWNEASVILNQGKREEGESCGSNATGAHGSYQDADLPEQMCLHLLITLRQFPKSLIF